MSIPPELHYMMLYTAFFFRNTQVKDENSTYSLFCSFILTSATNEATSSNMAIIMTRPLLDDVGRKCLLQQRNFSLSKKPKFKRNASDDTRTVLLLQSKTLFSADLSSTLEAKQIPVHGPH